MLHLGKMQISFHFALRLRDYFKIYDFIINADLGKMQINLHFALGLQFIL